MNNEEIEKAETKDQAVGVGSALAKGTLMATAATSGAVVGGVSGALVGVAGSLAAELLSVVIPNFKQQRYDKFVGEIEDRVTSLEGEAKERAESRSHSPEFADLFEDGARQAVRALSDERIEHIVNILENSLTDEEMNHAQRKRLLELLGQINDVELLLLQGEALYPDESRQFWQKHQDIVPQPAVLSSPQEVVDKSIAYNSYKEHLDDLGLLKRRYIKPFGSQKEVEFDFANGKVKASGSEATGLGRMLLHEIGLREPLRQGRNRDGTLRSERK